MSNAPFLATARLFGPGCPATGEPAQIVLDDHTIEAQTATRSHAASLSALRFRDVGTGLELAWDTPDGVWAVHVFDADALRRLRAHAPLESSPRMTALRTRQQRRAIWRTLGWGLIAALALSPALLLVAFIWQSDRIALAAAKGVSVEDEVRLGEQAFASMRATLDLQDSGRAFEAVQALGRRLTQGSRYRYRFYVSKSDEINAFALPGGIIVVNTGLIAATRRPEELAGVLAHEVQHVEQRHSLQGAIKDLGLRGVWVLVTGELGGSALGQAALELTSLSFSREAEAQADKHGFDAMAAHGVDPSGMADFFAVLTKRDGAAPPAFLSTHPASTAREQALRARIQVLSERRFEPLTMKPWPPQTTP
ncbi:MAG TPA: M48 family metallopeptidase [Steroidobacter sp.]|nr:M48 family metallopeptidase [Steroidobacter sp.]